MVEEDPYYLDTMLQLHYWHAQYRALGESGVDYVCMEVVSHRPAEAAVFAKVWAGYESLFRYLDVATLMPQPVRRDGISAEYLVLSGAGLDALLDSERGVHLWFAEQDQAVPLSVRITRLNDVDSPLMQAAELSPRHLAGGPGPIIRLYHETRIPYQFVVTDLRSNLVRRSTEALAANDWKLLLYHGKLQLPADLLAT